MNISRRETITALAALSVAAAGATDATAGQAPPQLDPNKLVETPLRNIAQLALRPDGSAVEFPPEMAGTIEGRPFWKGQAPDIEHDFQKMKVKVDGRGTTMLSGTLTASDLQKLPRHTQITLLQCGAPTPRGIVKWTGVRFSDFANSISAQKFANFVRCTAADDYYLDEDINIMMHPQVMLAWMMNDRPLPPEYGAPMRLIVPFRYGARSIKAITSIAFTATSFPPQKPWPA